MQMSCLYGVVKLKVRRDIYVRRYRTIGVDITTEDKKVEIPDDKEQIKIILGFLDEETYKSLSYKEHFWQIQSGIIIVKMLFYNRL